MKPTVMLVAGVALLVIGFAMTLEDVQRAMHEEFTGELVEPSNPLDEAWVLAHNRRSFWGNLDWGRGWTNWIPGLAEVIGWGVITVGATLLGLGYRGRREDTG